jgi:hypothetical protein
MFTENLVHLGLITDTLHPIRPPIWVAFRFPTRLQHLLPHRLGMYRHGGRALAYVYFEEEPGRRAAAHL